MDRIPRLRVNLLGELCATYDGAPLDLGGRRQRAVLAVLLLAKGDTVPADRLVESVWADRPPADAAGALQAYVSHLRRRLQPGSPARTRSAVIVREGRGYAVRLPVDAVDAWRFERTLHEAGAEPDPGRVAALLGEALESWRGPALADYADEPWAEAEIARLTELRTLARERLLAARLEVGEAAGLVADLEAMVAEEPLREERWRLLALALYRAHRQADALGALRRARSTLAGELGVDPGPALRDLERRVLAQAPELTVPTRPPGAPSPAPAADVPDELFDRERELAAVRAAVDALVSGEPRLVLIEGPAGIGKTRLLTEVRRLAEHRSVRVLTARGSQLEQSFGFGAVRQLFEPPLMADPGQRAALLGGAAASARSVFEPTGGESPDGSFATLHGLYWLAVNLTAGGPVLLAIDDVQWCDSASLRSLAYLARRLEAIPVLVVATVRTGEQHEDDELLAELSLEPSAVVLRPGTLSAGAVEELVARRLGGPVSPLFARACHRTTSGSPFLLRQLLRALEADRVRPDAAHADLVVAVGSRAVSSTVLMRLRRLGGPATVVARAAAVLGDGCALPVVAALAGVPEPDTATALAALARADIVRDEQPVAFVHPLVREAVYRDLPAAELALRHEEAARLLGAATASDEQVAAHLLLAPVRGDSAAVEVLRRAARTAAERGAPDSAVTYLRRALAETPGGARRCDVLRELGLLESLADGPAGTQHLLEAYEELADPQERADVAVAIARTQVFAGPPGAATAFARHAAEALPGALDDHRQALLAIELVSGYMHALDPALWRHPVPEPHGEGHGAQMLAAALAYDVTIEGADRERAVRLARFALSGDPLWSVDQGLFWVVAAIIRMLADDDLGDFWARARAEAHARGSLFAVLSTNLWQGFWHWRRGELAEAESCLTNAIEESSMWGGGIAPPFAHAFLIGCHLDRGDLVAARATVDATGDGPRPGDGGRLLQLAVARVLAAEGRSEQALAALDAVPTPVPVANPVWNPWRSTAALALQARGRTAEAVPFVAEEARLLRRWGAPSHLGASLRLLGELRGSRGLAELREAVDLLATTPAAVELARARGALGARPEVPDHEAVPLLRSAVEEAHARGAVEVRDRARAALRARGEPDAVHRPDVRVVTATERRILDLAAAGCGVREIAQQLFLTPGTVQRALEAASPDGLKFRSSRPPDARSPATGRTP